MESIDRMGIRRTDGISDNERYGSLYLIKRRANNVNEYGGSDEADVSKLAAITNAAPGSTCLFINGDIYRLELTGWKKFGEEAETETASSNSSPASLNLSPVGISKADLTSDVSFDEGEGSTLEAQKSAVTSSTADEVSV